VTCAVADLLGSETDVARIVTDDMSGRFVEHGPM
jgi:hypothetical protein